MNINSQVSTFWYNFRWSDWIGYVDGWIARFSFFVLLLGCLILFNDNITSLLKFNELTGSYDLFDGISSSERLRLIYFGLIFIGLGNIIFRVKKPYIFRFGKNIREYTTNCLNTLSFDSFQRLHFGIREDGHFTHSGKYYDSEWDGFKEAALNQGEGTGSVKRTGHWEDAKLRYGSLLRAILNENFFKKDVALKGWLLLCVVLSSIGYLLLIIPSFELFTKVVASTFCIDCVPK